MNTIYIFNPETDYALAANVAMYTTPPKVVQVRRHLALCQTRCAGPGDVILLLDAPEEKTIRAIDATPDYIRIILPEMISDFAKNVANEVAINPNRWRIQPWGWNLSIIRFLLKAGFPESLLPSHSNIEKYRHLSHRHSSIEFNRLLNQKLAEAGFSQKHLSPIPLEIKDVEDAMAEIKANPDRFVKAPWSSSGRGIMKTDLHTSLSKISQWIGGTIRRQGSVMLEVAADKAIDFATEWYVAAGVPRFLGLSLFNASEDGKYGSNLLLEQEEILAQIKNIATDFDEEFIRIQGDVLREIAADYEGYVGIDMLAEKDGSIRGCVEINFRMTMGVVALGNTLNTLQL